MGKFTTDSTSNVEDISATQKMDNIAKTPDFDQLHGLRELAHTQEDTCWELLEGVFSNLRQGILVADLTGKVLIFNAVAERILGYASTEIVGKWLLWDFCESSQFQPKFCEPLLRGHSFSDEAVEMISQSGLGSVGVKITPLYGSQGKLIGAMGTIRSLTELPAQQHDDKSLVRMAAVGRIISALAHEINNPLQTVRTSLELGLDQRKSAARRKSYLETADSEISRITRLINHMRSFYRPVPGDKKPTNVTQTLENTVNVLNKQISAGKVNLVLNLAPYLPDIRLVDYQLEQVFLNLILNALESMPEGGTLTISTFTEDDKVLVVFKDSAHKLEPLHAANLFDPFSNYGRVGELALGLSVSREIVQEMGGSIEVLPGDSNMLIMHLPG